MGFIYENQEEYAKTCQCDLETAKLRCDYFLNLHNKMEKVKCPSCQSTYDKLTFDNDGGDYPSETFISCTECWETFDENDERLKDWVQYQIEFDEVLSFALSGIPTVEELGSNWDDFVKKSTKELLATNV